MTKILAFSCLHAPITHKGYFEWLLGQIREFKPQIIVNLGDLYEGKWAKKWAKHADEAWSVLEEHKSVAGLITDINKAAPKATKWWLYGNHCSNSFEVHPGRTESDIVPALHWRENREASKALENWKVIEKYGHDVYKRLGPITFRHGCDLSVAGIKRETIYYATPYGLHVAGHTHRPTPVTQLELAGANLPYWQCNPGCGADWDKMHYMSRLNKQGWGRGIVLIETAGVEQSRAAYLSKQWDAEVRIHSLADNRF